MRYFRVPNIDRSNRCEGCSFHHPVEHCKRKPGYISCINEDVREESHGFNHKYRYYHYKPITQINPKIIIL